MTGDPDGSGFVWLDGEALTPDELAVARERFGIGVPLPLDAARMPRPTILEEEGYLLVTLVGPDADGGLAEVRCAVGPEWMLTLHARPIPALDDIPAPPQSAPDALAALAKALVTGLVGVVRDLDDTVERIEDGDASDATAIKRRLTSLRRVVLTQHDVLTRLGGGDGPAPREDAASRNLRNSSERMAQIGVEVETLREALHDAASDRQNEIVKRLTVVAAIFLPLTFLTGFFGQNFTWMVENVDSPAAFVILGIGLPIAGVGALLLVFRRNGWL